MKSILARNTSSEISIARSGKGGSSEATRSRSPQVLAKAAIWTSLIWMPFATIAETNAAVEELKSTLSDEQAILKEADVKRIILERTRAETVELSERIDAIVRQHTSIVADFRSHLAQAAAHWQQIQDGSDEDRRQIELVTDYVASVMNRLSSSTLSAALPDDFSETFRNWTKPGAVCADSPTRRAAGSVAQIAGRALPDLIEAHRRLIAGVTLPSSHAEIVSTLKAANSDMSSAARQLTNQVASLHAFAATPKICGAFRNLAVVASLKNALIFVEGGAQGMREVEAELRASLLALDQVVVAGRFATVVRRSATAMGTRVLALVNDSKPSEARLAAMQAMQGIALLREDLEESPLPDDSLTDLSKHLDEAEAAVTEQIRVRLQDLSSVAGMIRHRLRLLRLKILQGLSSGSTDLTRLQNLANRLESELGVGLRGPVPLPDFDNVEAALEFDRKVEALEAELSGHAPHQR